MKTKDEQIKKRIIDSLYREKKVDISSITVKVKGGFVELGGTLSMASSRQIIENCVSEIPEINQIYNHIIILKNNPEGYLTHVA